MSKEKKKRGIGKFLLGAGLGAGLGVLFAPKKGSDTRKDLKNKLNELVDQVKNIEIDEVKKEFELKIEEIKKDIEELDKEKVLKIAKEQAKNIEIKCQELVDYAVEKGTPIIEATANKAKEKAIDVTKQILAKLEEN